MRLKQLIWGSLFLLCCCPAWSQTTIEVIHPQDPWYWDFGRLKEATVTLQPQGQYLEVGLYFTMDFPDNWWGDQDSLEIVYDFKLPDGAILNDSWLWVEDEIVRAFLWDFWTANEVYEGFVNRNVDPSLLYETDVSTYQLRIFPLLGQDSRKVKINYLIPFQKWEEGVAEISLLLQDVYPESYYQPETFRLLVYPQEGWSDYQFVHHPNWEAEQIFDPEYGAVWEFPVTVNDLNTNLTFSAQSPMQNGLLVGHYQGPEDQYLQVTLDPKSYFEFEEDKQLLVLVDRHSANSDFLFYTLWDGLRDQLIEELDENDQFNVIVNQNPYSYYAFYDWQPGQDSIIQSSFDGVSPMSFESGSGLVDFLAIGLQWAENMGDQAEIILVTNSNELYGQGNAEAAVNELSPFANSGIPIHIFDFQNEFSNSPQTIGGLTYQGNSYFHNLLQGTFGGGQVNMQNGNYSWVENLDNLWGQMELVSGFSELQVDPTNGFTYDTYSLESNETQDMINAPKLLNAKYYGEFPLTVTYELVSEQGYQEVEFLIDATDVIELDSLAEESWAGHYINELEGAGQSPAQVQATIEASKKYRVLSAVTAFIALDPVLGGEPCINCLTGWENDWVISATEEPKPEIKAQVFPNPFAEQLHIAIKSPEIQYVEIYDTRAKRVWAYDLQGVDWTEQITWNGRDLSGAELPNGWYVVVLHLADGSQQLEKVLLLK